MRATTATNFRKNLARELDRLNTDHVPLVITRTGGKPGAVLIPLDQFGSQDATDYLTSSAANKARLDAAIARFETASGRRFTLPE